jgi:probable rRNA maturation factor
MPAGVQRRRAARIGRNGNGRRLRVLVADGRGRSVAAPGVARWLARVAPAAARGTVSVALVSDARIRALNRAHRGIDRVTDVLSFGGPSSSPSPQPPVPSPFLGDVVIARGAARRQARAAGHSELTEVRVLALHGLLHLLGYDHQGDGGRMRRVERRLRRKGGLREGLIERAHSSRRPHGGSARSGQA